MTNAVRYETLYFSEKEADHKEKNERLFNRFKKLKEVECLTSKL